MYQPLLEIDLTTGTMTPLELPREVRERWLGGTGLGLYLLSKEIRRGMKVTDPDCPVFILTGPLGGTAVPQSTDMVIVTVNAEFSRNVCASHAHGFFAARLRHAGWDGIILRGRAAKPVYLWIDGDNVELRPADHLWGQDTFETQRRIIDANSEAGPDISVYCIGQAGESLIEGSSVRGDWAYGANQGGSGVAFGAKNFKAMAVVETGTVPVRDATRLEEIGARWQAAIATANPGFPESKNYDGFKYMTGPLADLGWIMGKNFTDPEVGVAWSARLAKDSAKWKFEAVGGWNCQAACHYKAKCTTGPMAGLEFTGYGGEIMEELGPNLGIEDPGVAFMLSGLVDGYGMAAKGAPRTIAMLMEAFNDKLITSEQIDGLDLTWGNYTSVMALLEKTVTREGVGELIAQGLMATAKAFGIEDRAMHMHGVGFNDHDPRATPMVMFQMQVASGAGPNWQTLVEMMMGRPEPDLGYEESLTAKDIDRIAEASHVTQKAKLLYDSLGACYFSFIGVRGILGYISESLDAAAGVHISPDELLAIGDRVLTLQRLINIYLGYTPADDFDIAERLFEPIPSGPVAGNGLTRDDFVRIRDEFYEFQGWSLLTGAPTDETLARLGLHDIHVGAVVGGNT
ncbi:MAG: hypothetical protein F2911_02035 [Actinobacteria bacterium]|uniref:Unannotated protein n=1 Tax=freshwater metagenome TaxID=449393 RepID=A0A6J7R5K2_9ZZZZ|nr:hypothetical protein [Actinomycetota bacterium]